jgi:hypothetical protein
MPFSLQTSQILAKQELVRWHHEIVIVEFDAHLNCSQGFDQVGLIGKHIARMVRIEGGLGQWIEPPIARGSRG